MPSPLPDTVARFVARLAEIPVRDWLGALGISRLRPPGDRALLEALTALTVACARSGRTEARREVEAEVRRVTSSLDCFVRAREAGGGGNFTATDVAALEFLAEWGAVALLVRDVLPGRDFEVLYAPWGWCIPLAS